MKFRVLLAILLFPVLASAGALVEELSDSNQDVDGRAAQLGMAVQFGRVDDDTVLPVKISSDGIPIVKITDGTDTVSLTSHEGMVSLDTVVGHRETWFIHLDAENVQAATGYLLIDLSDATNWPHTDTDHIILEWLTININPDGSFAGDVELGFLSAVDGDNGDFNVIHDLHLDRKASEILATFMHDNHGLDLELANWFGPTTANDTTWQTDVNIQGPDGASSYPSGDGDFVMKINRTAGAVDIGISVGYTTR